MNDQPHPNKKQKTEHTPIGFEHLPDEVIVNICSYLDPKNIGNVANVSNRLKRITNEAEVWRSSFWNMPESCFEQFKAEENKNLAAYGKIVENHETAKAILNWLFKASQDDENSSDNELDLSQDFIEDWDGFYKENLLNKNESFVEIANYIVSILKDENNEYKKNLSSEGRADKTVMDLFTLIGNIDALNLLIESGAVLDKKNVWNTALKNEKFSFELFLWLMGQGIDFGLNDCTTSPFLFELIKHFHNEQIDEDSFVSIIGFICYIQSITAPQNISIILNAIFYKFRPVEAELENFDPTTDENFQYCEQLYQRIKEAFQANFQVAALPSSELKRNTMS